MSYNDSDKFYFPNRARSRTAILWFLFFLVTLSLAANVDQYLLSRKLARETAAAQREVEAQVAGMRVVGYFELSTQISASESTSSLDTLLDSSSPTRLPESTLMSSIPTMRASVTLPSALRS